MAKTFKIYTCGNGTDAYEDMDWRRKFEIMLRESTYCELVFAHPPLYYFYLRNADAETDVDEMYEWELSHISDCDIVVICTDSLEDTALNMMELAYDLGYINALNRNGKNIKVVAFGKEKLDYSWFNLKTHTEETMEDAVDYIINLLLI